MLFLLIALFVFAVCVVMNYCASLREDADRERHLDVQLYQTARELTETCTTLDGAPSTASTELLWNVARELADTIGQCEHRRIRNGYDWVLTQSIKHLKKQARSTDPAALRQAAESVRDAAWGLLDESGRRREQILLCVR